MSKHEPGRRKKWNSKRNTSLCANGVKVSVPRNTMNTDSKNQRTAIPKSGVLYIVRCTRSRSLFSALASTVR